MKVVSIGPSDHPYCVRPGYRVGAAADLAPSRGSGSLISGHGRHSMILEVRDLHAYSGQSHIRHGVDLGVGRRRDRQPVGRNGVGRSNACKAIMGVVAAKGTVMKRFAARISPSSAGSGGRTRHGYGPADRRISFRR